jgi:hypothetical protein
MMRDWFGLTQRSSFRFPDQIDIWFEAIKVADWDRVLFLLQGRPGRPSLLNIWQPEDESFSTVLHFAAEFGAPIQVVQQLVSVKLMNETEKDSMN